MSADHEEALAPQGAPADALAGAEAADRLAGADAADRLAGAEAADRLASTDVVFDEPTQRKSADGPASADWWLWLRLVLLDVAVGLSWALMLAGAVLFITGVSQFIYVDF